MKKRSKFSLSNYKMLSANQGLIFPINCVEVLPGDTIQQKSSAMIRVAPLATPVMHPVHARIHHFFVPNRIIWDDWEDFITGGKYGSTPPVHPTIKLTTGTAGAGIGGLIDYLGIRPMGTLEADKTVSALPIRAYQKIVDDWFIDQDLMTESNISTASGNDTTTSLAIRRASWGKDYFTTARPWSQKSANVLIPAEDASLSANGSATVIRNVSGGGTFNSQDLGTNGSGQLANVGLTATAYIDPSTSMTANVKNAMGTINDLRFAEGMQAYAEARAIYGSRYVEYLRYLGVTSSDARLQNAEYLGGGTSTIQFSEVLQTAEGEDPVGTMRGHGIAGMGTNRYRKFFEEHGFIISVVSVLPVPVYADACERFWLKRTKEDYFQRELQHIGMQEISTAEVMFTGDNQAEGINFGYQLRYDEYRRALHSVAGEFRGALIDWNMARFFEDPPVLNDDFVSATPTNRIYANTDGDQLYIMVHNSIQARRIIAQSGKPKVL